MFGDFGLAWEYGDGGNVRGFGRVNWGLNPFYCSFSEWSVSEYWNDGFTWDLGFPSTVGDKNNATCENQTAPQ